MALTVYSIILIILACIFPFFALGVAIVFMCYYGTPDDYKMVTCCDKEIPLIPLGCFPRGIIVLSFMLGLLSVFLLPLDIADARLGAGMNFGLGIVWQVKTIVYFAELLIGFLWNRMYFHCSHHSVHNLLLRV